MKFALLIYSDESIWAEASPEANQQVLAEYMALGAELEARGVLVAGEGLDDTKVATTVRRRGGKTLTTDGPFAETKEQLGGFYLVDVASLEEALAIAARLPSARVGSVEVRPVL